MRYLLLLPPLLWLSSCAGPASLRPDFGVSTRQNIAMQTIDPGAADRSRALAPVDGQKAEKALSRYRADRPDSSRGRLVQDAGGK